MAVAEKRQVTAEKRQKTVAEKRQGETPDERWVRLDKIKKQMLKARGDCLGRHLRPNHMRYLVRTLV